MFKFFRDYYWKQGLPYGQGPLSQGAGGDAFKIVMDPYRKRVSIERYKNGAFVGIDYDSQWLNFRHLKPEHQLQWQREVILENVATTVNLIRDQDDRIILKEVIEFEEDYCKTCKVYTPSDNPISIHRMFYQALSDPFDGVTLYDNNERIVLRKYYSFDESERVFTDLIKEEWDFSRA